MKRKPFGPRLTFIAATGAALAYWPAACASHAQRPVSSSPAAAATSPASVPPATNLTILPHPAFAYADTGGSQASIADIAEKAAPSVVNVASSRTIKRVRNEGMPFFEDPFFRRFFGPGGMGNGQEPEERHQEHGLGSGVVVSNDGIVLTNNHVVDGADEIKVTTADKREFNAKVLGTDAKSDVAVLKLQGDTKGLVPLAIGDSSRLRLGDVVLAIGNPFGVGQTITMGIVSAKGRANVGIAAYEDFIQTDAAINPGNSGGALVDMEGHLVGINTAILSRSGGSQGIGFAIPTNMAQPIMKSLIDHGKVVRGWLGVGIQDVDQELASAMKLHDVRGILISDVMDAGPGAKAGLKSGDVVLKVDGVGVESTGSFRNAIAAAGTGTTVKLDLLRDGKPLSLDAKLGELPPDKAQGAASAAGAGPVGVLDGLTMSDLTPAVRRKLDLPASVKGGVVVEELDQGSNAANSGLRPGDVVVEVDRQAVTDVGKFKELYSRAKDRALLRVVREGRSLYIVVRR
ncbi:MAG TPA: DegQ family serine endoprotease [Polyangiaceae bacterium]|nr:DegQ family serine endoprotease [Polyangiaceae bacterium]